MEEKQLSFYERGQVICVDKPLGWTSFAVVRTIRNLVKIKKVGHAGTLDPLATGLLIICTGKFTKRITEFMASEKEYTGTITLGASTPTFDKESDPEHLVDIAHLHPQQIYDAAKTLTGQIMQVPPVHSAIKQNGRRVYELARKGKEVVMEPRKITIHEFDITAINFPEVSFRVVCSTGTYIRSLANDIGAMLGVGGYLSSLCRTRIGTITLDPSMDLKCVEKRILESVANEV